MPAPLDNIKLSKAPKEQKTPALATIDEFLAQTKSIYVKAGESVEIPIEYIPLLNCQKQCFVIISNEQIGDFVSQINASGTLDTRTANNLDEEEVLFWKCHIGEKNKIRIKMDLRNQKLVHAVQKLAKYQMSQGMVLTRPVYQNKLDFGFKSRPKSVLRGHPNRTHHEFHITNRY